MKIASKPLKNQDKQDSTEFKEIEALRRKPKQQINPSSHLSSKYTTARNKVTIHLCSKFLTFFPDSLFNLTHLKVIDLGQNNIEDLPSRIGEFRNLTVVFINLASLFE